MGKLFVVIFALIALPACTSQGRTESTLKSAGFTDVEVGGYDFFGCGEDDTYKTKFRARNSNGVMVDGTVCCGLITKGCTIRF